MERVPPFASWPIVTPCDEIRISSLGECYALLCSRADSISRIELLAKRRIQLPAKREREWFEEERVSNPQILGFLFPSVEWRTTCHRRYRCSLPRPRPRPRPPRRRRRRRRRKSWILTTTAACFSHQIPILILITLGSVVFFSTTRPPLESTSERYLHTFSRLLFCFRFSHLSRSENTTCVDRMWWWISDLT